MQPPAAVGREMGKTLAGAGGPIVLKLAVHILSLAEFRFRRSGKRSNHFSRKSHFREKFLSRSERASAASAMSGALPPLFRAQRSGSEKFVRQTPICLKDGKRKSQDISFHQKNCPLLYSALKILLNICILTRGRSIPFSQKRAIYSMITLFPVMTACIHKTENLF